ncbi:MAG: hypothetical protein ACR2PG_14785 [Hyphomicrobiaceae bacterium]
MTEAGLVARTAVNECMARQKKGAGNGSQFLAATLSGHTQSRARKDHTDDLHSEALALILKQRSRRRPASQDSIFVPTSASPVTNVLPATIAITDTGVFSAKQGGSIYVESDKNRIFLAFPAKKGKASRGAYWPGPMNHRPACTQLDSYEYELVINGEAVCVQMGTTLDTWHSIGKPMDGYQGGCRLDVVRIENASKEPRMVLRTECSPVKKLSQRDED